jgi:hypothetical protein
MRSVAHCLTVALVCLVSFSSSAFAVTIFDAPGAFTTADDAVTAFRAALGNPNNGNAAGPVVGGRREINWDGGGNPDGTITNLPTLAAFQNRGIIFTTPGTGFAQAPVASGDNNLSQLFGVDYSTTFTFFSPVRLFVPIGDHVTDAVFSLPGSNGAIPAGTRAFGAVFSDADLSDETTIDFFGISGLITSLSVPEVPGNGNLSFLGIVLGPNEGLITNLRITTGTAPLGVADNPGQAIDVVAMDDFLFAEPLQVPQPPPMLLVGSGLIAVRVIVWRARRRP